MAQVTIEQIRSVVHLETARHRWERDEKQGLTRRNLQLITLYFRRWKGVWNSGRGEETVTTLTCHCEYGNVQTNQQKDCHCMLPIYHSKSSFSKKLQQCLHRKLCATLQWPVPQSLGQTHRTTKDTSRNIAKKFGELSRSWCLCYEEYCACLQRDKLDACWACEALSVRDELCYCK